MTPLSAVSVYPRVRAGGVLLDLEVGTGLVGLVPGLCRRGRTVIRHWYHALVSLLSLQGLLM